MCQPGDLVYSDDYREQFLVADVEFRDGVTWLWVFDSSLNELSMPESRFRPAPSLPV